MSDRNAVIKNADMSDEMQQVSCYFLGSFLSQGLR